MSKHNQYYRDTDFTPGQSAGYTLLLQTDHESFSYAVVGQNKLLAFEEGLRLDELTKPSEGNELLSGGYRQRIVGLPQDGFTLVPASIYKPELIADFARFLDVKPYEKVFSQALDAANQVIYKLNENLAALTGTFEIKDIVFAATGWIAAIAADAPSPKTLYLNIGTERVEILNFAEGKLRFYNCFEFKNADELVYFASLVADELQLPQNGTKLIISGDSENGDPNSRRLAEFFDKVEFNQLKPVEIPAQITSHTVLSLTALSLCGSSAER